MVDSLLRGLLGLFFLLGVCYLLSNNRKKIDWKLANQGFINNQKQSLTLGICSIYQGNK